MRSQKLMTIRRNKQAEQAIRHRTKKSERMLSNGQVVRTMIDVPIKEIQHRKEVKR